MRKTTMHPMKRLLSAFLVLVILLGTMSGVTFATSRAESTPVTDEPVVGLAQAQADMAQIREEAGLVQGDIDDLDPDQVIRVMVQTKDTPVYDMMERNSSVTMQSAQTTAMSRQESVITQAQKITGNPAINQSVYLVNTFTMEMTVSQMAEIAALEQVLSVAPVTEFHLTMKRAVDMTTVTEMWENMGHTGEGMAIAVIDTGVNYDHPDMRLDPGAKVKYTKQDAMRLINELGHGTYYSAKVPFGYSYVGSWDFKNDEQTHGSHVSGIAAANGGIVGVAPNAQIIGMQVFDQYSNAYTDEIIRAIEDAVKLDVDVVNMSLGSTAGFYGDMDYLQAALERAAEEGILCCVAAGNDGTSASMLGINTNELGVVDTGAVSAPGTAPSALAVASLNNAYYYGRSIQVTDSSGNMQQSAAFNFSYYYENGFISAMPDRAWDKMVDVALVDCGLGRAEDLAGISPEGQWVAIVERGENSFDEKITNCINAGAAGVVVYNNEASDIVPNNVSAPSAQYNIMVFRMILVSGHMGTFLKEIAQTGGTVTFSEFLDDYVIAADGREMSSFSSWGPTPSLDIKPEISAPGGNIRSLTSGSDYVNNSGTSMATPYVAGSAALVLEAIKDSALELGELNEAQYAKLALMNTADPVLYKDDGRPYSVRQQGAGMVDPAGAARTTVIATYNDLASVALKEIGETARFTITLTNYGKEDKTYTLSQETLYTELTLEDATYTVRRIDGASVIYDKASVTVPAGGTAEVTAVLSVGSLEQNHYVEGFLTLVGQDCESLSLPLLAFYGDWYGCQNIIDVPSYDGNNILSNASGMIATGIAAGSYFAGMNEEGKILPENVAFSPNGDGHMDDSFVLLGMLRGAETVTVDVLDAEQNHLRRLGTVYEVPKVLYSNANYNATYSPVPYMSIMTNLGWGTWDGTAYDAKTGTYEMCPEGQYYMQVSATMPGSDKTQTLTMPVRIDITRPAGQILETGYDEEAGTLQVRFRASDNMNFFDTAVLYINGSQARVRRSECQEADGAYIATLNTSAYQPGQFNEIALYLEDFAGNGSIVYIYEYPSQDQAVVFSTLTNAQDSWPESYQVTTTPDAWSDEVVDGEAIQVHYHDIRGAVSRDVAKLTIDGTEISISEDGGFQHYAVVAPGKNAYQVKAWNAEGDLVFDQVKLLFSSIGLTVDVTVYPEEMDKVKYSWWPSSPFVSSNYMYGYGSAYTEVAPLEICFEDLEMVKSVEVRYVAPDQTLTAMQLLALDVLHPDDAEASYGVRFERFELDGSELIEKDSKLWLYFDLPFASHDPGDGREGLGFGAGYITVTDMTGQKHYANVHVENDAMSAVPTHLDYDILNSMIDVRMEHINVDSVITDEDLDENGCLTIEGKFKMPWDDIYYDGQRIGEGQEFAVDFKPCPGINYFKIYTRRFVSPSDTVYDGFCFTWFVYYLPEPTRITFDNTAIADGVVIEMDAETFDLSGYVTSYMRGLNLTVNGENHLLDLTRLSTDFGQPDQRNFSCQVALEPGVNPIEVNLRDVSGMDTTIRFLVIKTCEGSDDCTSAAFTDLSADAWYHAYTDHVIDNGLMNGMGGDRFAPNGTVTRAMIVATLYRMAGQPEVTAATSFTDVKAEQWYTDAIAWAETSGITEGLTETTFGPTVSVTREQAATFLYRYVTMHLGDEPAEGADLSRFSDSNTVSGYAAEAMAWAVAEGLFEGFADGTLRARETLTRAQLAKLLTILDQRF